MSRNKTNITIYWIVRLYTQILAGLLIVLMIVTSISPPTVEAPSPQDAPFAFLPFFLTAFLFLLPYRCSAERTYHRIRLSLYFLASIWLLYKGITDLYIFRFQFFESVAALTLVLLAVSAPFSLLLHRRLKQAEEGKSKITQ